MAEAIPATCSAEAVVDIQTEIQELFEKYDADGDGSIDRQELAYLLQRSNKEAWTDERLEALLSQIDTNGDSRIDFEEFLAWVFSDKIGQKTVKEASAGAQKHEEADPNSEPYDGPRWMLHDRMSRDYPRTKLRIHPIDAQEYKPQCALNGEVVEVFGSSGNYMNVKLALSRATGWLHKKFLHSCIEGAVGAACSTFERLELKPSDGRLKEVRKYLRRRNTSLKGSDIRASRIWFLKGHYLGQVGFASNGPKETLFFGCQDSLVESIANRGFSDVFPSLEGLFGKGAHLSPQSCKAFRSSENYLFICEAALGREEERLTLECPHPQLDHHEVCQVRQKLSAQCHAGPQFAHEERVVYHPAQCKPVYLLQLETPGCYKLLNSDNPYKDLLEKH